VPNDSYDKYKELLAPNYGYCSFEQINELTMTITNKNNSYDKQFNETYNKYKNINDTLVALLEANVIELLQVQIDSIKKKKDEIYNTSFNNVKNIYYTGVYVVIVTAEFSKYTRAQLDSIALYKAFNDCIQKFCKTTVSDTIKYTQYDGISRNSNIYRSLNLEIIGNAKAGTKVSELISYQPDRDFFFKVYEVNIYPFSKSQPNFNSLNNFSKNIANNSLYTLYSYDVFSPSQSLKDFLEQQKNKYNLFSHEVDKIINFVDRLKLEIPDKNLDQYKNEVEEIKKITNKLNEYDKQIASLEKEIEIHKNTIKRIITNQTEGKCIYNPANLKQSVKTAIDYFNNKLSSIELELQAISQKRYFHDIISFKSGEQGYIWEQIFTQIKAGNNTNNLKTIEQRISADYELFKKITVIISSDNDNSNTSSITKKTESVTYSRKLYKYWLFLQLDPPTGNINIHVVSVCKNTKTSKGEKEKTESIKIPDNINEIKEENLDIEKNEATENNRIINEEINNRKNKIFQMLKNIDLISSSNDDYRKEMLNSLIPDIKNEDNDILFAFLNSVDKFTSANDDFRRDVLLNFLKVVNIDKIVLIRFLNSVNRFTSANDDYRKKVLLSFIPKLTTDSDLLVKFLNNVDCFTSANDDYRRDVLIAFLPKLTTDKKVNDAFNYSISKFTSANDDYRKAVLKKYYENK